MMFICLIFLNLLGKLHKFYIFNIKNIKNKDCLGVLAMGLEDTETDFNFMKADSKLNGSILTFKV